MCSYNSVCVGPSCDPSVINGTGIPSCADGAFQNGVVRGDWGWDGFIVSDCDAVGNVYSPHHFASTPVEAAALSVLGGTDVDCGTTYPQNLVQTVAAGNVSVADLQLAAQRNLRVAFATGVFDPVGSNVYDSYGTDLIDSADHRALALDAAVQGIALLANNATATPWGAGLPLLPLRAASLKRVAVIGPNANATLALLSNYEGGNTLVLNHSLLQALTARGAAAGFDVSYAPGCVNSTGGVYTWCQETTGFAAAVAAAQAADVVVLAVGLCSVCPEDGWRLEGEGHDRQVLTLPGQQEALVQVRCQISIEDGRREALVHAPVVQISLRLPPSLLLRPALAGDRGHGRPRRRRPHPRRPPRRRVDLRSHARDRRRALPRRARRRRGHRHPLWRHVALGPPHDDCLPRGVRLAAAHDRHAGAVEGGERRT